MLGVNPTTRVWGGRGSTPAPSATGAFWEKFPWAKPHCRELQVPSHSRSTKRSKKLGELAWPCKRNGAARFLVFNTCAYTLFAHPRSRASE